MGPSKMITHAGNLKTFWRLPIRTRNKSHSPRNCLQQISSIHPSPYQEWQHIESANPLSSRGEGRRHLWRSTTTGMTEKIRTSPSMTIPSSIKNQQNMCSAQIQGSPQLHWCTSPTTAHNTLTSPWLAISYVLHHPSDSLSLSHS
jgi:hypothetical protein